MLRRGRGLLGAGDRDYLYELSSRRCLDLRDAVSIVVDQQHAELAATRLVGADFGLI